MDILIRGMKIPKNCDECRIMVFEDTNCAPELYCGCPIVFKAHPQGVDHRPDYCPLIPVPEHGRLIDADALDMNYLRIRDDGMKIYTQRAIDNAPTIIQAEEG